MWSSKKAIWLHFIVCVCCFFFVSWIVVCSLVCCLMHHTRPLLFSCANVRRVCCFFCLLCRFSLLISVRAQFDLLWDAFLSISFSFISILCACITIALIQPLMHSRPQRFFRGQWQGNKTVGSVRLLSLPNGILCMRCSKKRYHQYKTLCIIA